MALTRCHGADFKGLTLSNKPYSTHPVNGTSVKNYAEMVDIDDVRRDVLPREDRNINALWAEPLHEIRSMALTSFRKKENTDKCPKNTNGQHAATAPSPIGENQFRCKKKKWKRRCIFVATAIKKMSRRRRDSTPAMNHSSRRRQSKANRMKWRRRPRLPAGLSAE